MPINPIALPIGLASMGILEAVQLFRLLPQVIIEAV